ncbi:MAG TPA: FtsX-like permease family protein, partial [Vicinamibacterales bacterium]
EGMSVASVIEPLRATFQTTQEERAKTFVGLPPEYLRAFLSRTLMAEAATAGVSGFQKTYTRALAALAGFVALVLLIACANISNLRLAQASARSREMALRVAIGAGRGRLIQLMLVESARVAGAGAAVGAIVAWASAPVVVSRLSGPGQALSLALPIDGRIAAFGLALTVVVALLFGLLPALRVSGTSALVALKGALAAGPQRQRLDVAVAAQIAFCALVLLVGGLFVSTYKRLSAQPTGFSAERVIDLDTVAQPSQPLPAWNDLIARLQATPGVEAAAAAQFALLSGDRSTGFIWINGAATTTTLAYFLGVTPGWFHVMDIPLVDGRDFRDTDPAPGVAIVNEAFAKEYFPGRNPLGQWFDRQLGAATRPSYQVVGLVRNARYQNLRETMTPTVYVPLGVVSSTSAPRPLAEATLVVRTSAADPTTLAAALRQTIRASPGFRVHAAETQQDIDEAQVVRERLLAALAWFFTSVALALTGVGIYGVVFYTVEQRQRDIGICRALGAPAGAIVRRVTAPLAAMLVAGTLGGLAAGLLVVRSFTALFYGVRATDALQLAVP